MPFAGTYFLSGKLNNLHSLRGVPSIDFAYDKINGLISNAKLLTKNIKINHGETFDLATGDASSLYKKFNENEFIKYSKNVLSKKKLDYEDDIPCDFDEIYELSKKSLERYLHRKLLNNLVTDTNIILDIGNKMIEIDNKKNNLNVINSESLEKRKKFVKYKLDNKLLKKILMGPKYAHWNNAEIGSHIQFFRNPNVFERKIYESMCYFHQ